VADVQMSFPPSPLAGLLDDLRERAQSEREKGAYFEKLVKLYLTQEPFYADLYAGKVWLWGEWRRECARRFATDPGVDAGIDLVAETTEGELHAIQAKFYAPDALIALNEFGTFFTASSKRHFARRLIFLTATRATTHLQEAWREQSPPVTLISLYDLERSKIDWSAYRLDMGTAPLRAGKQLRDYQEQAISNVTVGLTDADRGKLIMACGTGKTFTALRLAERMAGAGGRVLFLVPSLNLLSQTLTEWTQEAAIGLHSFAVCSDSEVGKKRLDQFNDFEMLAHELQYPATTHDATLARVVNHRHDGAHMTAVFSTYHSLDVISRAQHEFGLPEFDLILCDEAHRTTGATFDGVEESAFVKIHDPTVIHGRKRVYMTATPRIYGTQAKAKAETESITLFSMDNEAYFGKTLHTLTFSEAVHDLKILCDYKVIVLTVSEDHISRSLQTLLADADNSINVNDAAKIVGCWRALSKMDSQDDLGFDPAPMRRAVAFAQVIEMQTGARTHKISSKHIAGTFSQVVNEYRAALLKENPKHPDAISALLCEAEHVDGGMGAVEKEQRLAWLKAASPENTCRILSNVRCLSEGVDVPALDAVLFLTPRNSQVDVVQSVGRVMRKPRGGNKKLGYVILPVVIPADKSPEEALNDNQTYRVVWEVLQALRSHDDRFDAMINRMRFDGHDPARMEVIAITDNVSASWRKGASDKSSARAQAAQKAHSLGQATGVGQTGKPEQFEIKLGDLERAILAKVVEKCGNRLYWDEWAQDIARIAQTHITRLTTILDNPENKDEILAFVGFLDDLHADLNDSITRSEAIEMLAQHVITRPVFDALFAGYRFADHNPVSAAMQNVLTVLERHHLEKETGTLSRMYDSVRRRAADTRTLAGKQKLILELYNKFFYNAFPKMAERLGIVYTPVQIVDFILHSVNDVLRSQFQQTLGSRNVHILDPFTGTGTFITRLLQSGLIEPDELVSKYTNEVHANEIVLLAYYIAAINIEQVFHSLTGMEYIPFAGICLTDTFNLAAGAKEWHDEPTRDNSLRLKRQRESAIHVVIGNPPYSSGESTPYPTLDGRIRDTYAKSSNITMVRALYDSYIRAIRWASDRIGDRGVIGFVSNAGFIDGNAMDGMRKCLAEEFSDIYVLHLRGNARTTGERRRKERDNVFGQGSRAAIAISILVKNPAAASRGSVHFCDIGDYLTRDQKLAVISELGSISGTAPGKHWKRVQPDQHGDWCNQRTEDFYGHIKIGAKGGEGTQCIFSLYSNGPKTNRDAWCYNFSKSRLRKNIVQTIDTFNSELDSFAAERARNATLEPRDFVEKDVSKIAWADDLYARIKSGRKLKFDESCISSVLYRPFNRRWMYKSSDLNWSLYKIPSIFPDASSQNRMICINGVGSRAGTSALMVDRPIDLNSFDAGAQCFPRYRYDFSPNVQSNALDPLSQPNMFSDDDAQGRASDGANFECRDAISDTGLAHFAKVYPGERITKDDLFYYVYGLLHSKDYLTRYADNLLRELPRIPPVKSASDFWEFTDAGRKLADLHVQFEEAAPYRTGLVLTKPISELAASEFKVSQMKFGKGANGARHDKTTVIYNHNITICDIPLEAYDYVVNGKPALEWVMERQAVTTDKATGIINDANDWAVDTMDNPAYPFELLLRVITVSLETIKIVRGLPALDIIEAATVED
jgi:predicted helicase